MSEIKVRLSLLVPGATMLSSQDCEKNPKESYNQHKVFIEYTKGKGKHTKKVKETLLISTRKSRLVTHNMSICKEAYCSMITTPPDAKLLKTWNNMSVKEKLRSHFDLIAHDLNAASYSFEILDD